MRVYTESRLAVPDVVLFRLMERVLNTLEDDPISCHALARAMASVFSDYNVIYIDGYVKADVARFNHTWLITENNNLIDVYPVAVVGGPLLIAGENGPWQRIYLRTRDGWWDDEVNAKDVRQLAMILRRIRAELR